MPPKRKAATKKKEGPQAKKVKSEFEKVKTALKKGPSFRKKVHKIDNVAASLFSGGQVVEDFDCMLNQTNIGQNNNKYYVIQLIYCNGVYYVWTRWGRVGESGQSLKLGPFKKRADGEKSFNAKFTSKSRNKWADRANFLPVKGKYTLLEMGEDDGDGGETSEIQQTAKGAVASADYAPSKLDSDTQKLMDLIFKTDMFQHAMTQLKLDTKKLPLGKLSKPQIMKGFEVLEQIQEAVKSKKKGSSLSELSSQFYTIIPHSFGRTVPPVMKTEAEVREKMDMLLVLMDIESTQMLIKTAATSQPKKGNKKPHPLDEKYDMLDVKLDLVSHSSPEFKMIGEYIEKTKERTVSLLNMWCVERSGEDTRYRAHKNLANRKLLWHGTNIAVVAAILKSGLRIMPHSGGRVGRGLYFASENGKSAGYVGCNAQRLGVMFLNEVALGKQSVIHQNNCSITKPPAGYNSVLAQGNQEPDEKTYKELDFDGKKVVVPVGKPAPKNIKSHFHQSEYLIYDESQCRIRYLLLCKF